MARSLFQLLGVLKLRAPVPFVEKMDVVDVVKDLVGAGSTAPMKTMTGRTSRIPMIIFELAPQFLAGYRRRWRLSHQTQWS